MPRFAAVSCHNCYVTIVIVTVVRPARAIGRNERAFVQNARVALFNIVL